MKNIAVAKRYADALYEEAKVGNVVDAVMAELTQFSELIAQNADLAAVMASPVVMIKDKLDIVNALGKTSRFSTLLVYFLAILTDNRRVSLLPAVIKSYNERMMDERNEVKVHVAYAAPVDEQIKKSLMARLADITGKNVVLAESVEPQLLGGMRVVVGSVLYDSSVKGKLDNIRNKA